MEHAFHGVGQAAGDARRPGDGERFGAAGELAVEDEEGQAPEVVAVEVGDEYGRDLAGVESEAFKGAERGGTAVKEHRAGPARASQVDTGLATATAAEGIAAAAKVTVRAGSSGTAHIMTLRPDVGPGRRPVIHAPQRAPGGTCGEPRDGGVSAVAGQGCAERRLVAW